jgi:hypothetical protein
MKKSVLNSPPEGRRVQDDIIRTGQVSCCHTDFFVPYNKGQIFITRVDQVQAGENCSGQHPEEKNQNINCFVCFSKFIRKTENPLSKNNPFFIIKKIKKSYNLRLQKNVPVRSGQICN